jgi:hypothetical protein
MCKQSIDKEIQKALVILNKELKRVSSDREKVKAIEEEIDRLVKALEIVLLRKNID